MALDLELYRREILVQKHPPVRLSVVDIAPDAVRRTLLCLHGFGGRAAQWERQIQFFADEHRVIAPDLRGHGDSDRPNSRYDVATLLADLDALLDAVDAPERLIVLGHSFGGALAVEFALRHPTRVEQLVLVALAANLRLNPLLAALWKLPAPLLERIRRLLARHFSAPAFVLKRTYDQAMSPWAGETRLCQLQASTLVITGQRDLVFPRAEYQTVARQIPDAQSVVIPVSSHLVQLERADAVNRAIQRFLDAAPLTWRDHTDHSAAPSRERPWIRFYEAGVPATIVVPNQPLHRFLERAAQRFPHQSAARFFRTSLSYRDLEHGANRVANVLLNQGVQRGDRVMILLPNCPQAVMAYYAILKVGAVVVMADPRQPATELARQLSEVDASALIALREQGTTAREACALAGVPRLILTGLGDMLARWQRPFFRPRPGPDSLPVSPPTLVLDWLDLLARSSPIRPHVSVASDDLGVIQYTGGTTHQPKGVMLSHRNLVANTIQTRHWFSTAEEGRERILAVVPFSHAYGMATCMNVAVSLAATLILLPRFEVREVLETIQRERPTMFPGVPAMYVAINKFPGVRSYGLRSISACLSGAEPLPIEVQEAFEKLTRGVLVEGYGLTEAGPVTHANPLRGTRKTGSIGVPLPSTDARVAGPLTNEPLQPGQIGELQVRGPQVMMGYWSDDAATREAFVPDPAGGPPWLRTGDLARADADGFFQIIDRRRNVWQSPGGEMIFPRDIEEVLYEHPAIREVAAVPSTAAGGPPHVVVVLAKGEQATEAELLRWAARRLPPHLAPASVEFRSALPRTLVGKVARRELIASQATEEAS
ncbi:MAG: alpha/beta fold hydrolase [Ardenticatenaceae bacterium]|nr:alpha/beta fold hydrolase [Ardenticatenaceae bacterium]